MIVLYFFGYFFDVDILEFFSWSKDQTIKEIKKVGILAKESYLIQIRFRLSYFSTPCCYGWTWKLCREEHFLPTVTLICFAWSMNMKDLKGTKKTSFVREEDRLNVKVAILRTKSFFLQWWLYHVSMYYVNWFFFVYVVSDRHLWKKDFWSICFAWSMNMKDLMEKKQVGILLS